MQLLDEIGEFSPRPQAKTLGVILEAPRRTITLDAATVAALARYDGPGNVRELQNALTALAVRSPRRGVVPPTALPPQAKGSPMTTLRPPTRSVSEKREHAPSRPASPAKPMISFISRAQRAY